ncbi:MAG: acyl-CoA dehydrogenase family protein, partial [Candidatus Omnitrophica bacterium]|nr:acyl-CoA dehydrogenase family protein [Candidatus Omnitrophota bacterium]MBU1871977.1 acyl-CoA dehydrogenase family protein [Candidatus Omnitrophota bacterium]
MDYLLTEEQMMIKELCSKIAEEKIRPVAAELDKSEEFPREIMKVLARSDLFGIFIPEEYGGTVQLGPKQIVAGVLDLCIATEEFSRACAGVAVCYAASALGTFPIL